MIIFDDLSNLSCLDIEIHLNPLEIILLGKPGAYVNVYSSSHNKQGDCILLYLSCIMMFKSGKSQPSHCFSMLKPPVFELNRCFSLENHHFRFKPAFVDAWHVKPSLFRVFSGRFFNFTGRYKSKKMKWHRMYGKTTLSGRTSVFPVVEIGYFQSHQFPCVHL